MNPTSVFELYHPQQADPVRGLGEGLQIQAMRQQSEQRQLQTDQARMQVAEQQRAIDAQKAVESAISANSKLAEDGSFVTDWEGTKKSLTDQGLGRQALEVDLERRKHFEAAQKAIGAQMDASEKKLKLQSQILGAHQKMNWDLMKTDQVAYNTELAQKTIAFRGLLAKAVELGAMSRQEADQYAQLPYTPQLEQHIDMLAQAGLSRLQQIQEKRSEFNSFVDNQLKVTEIDKNKAQAPGIAAKADAEVRTNTAARLSNAALQGRESYERELAAVPDALRAQFPASSSVDWKNPSVVAEAVNRAGLTPEQADNAQGRKQREQAAAAQLVEQSRHNQAEEGLSAGRLAVERRNSAINEQRWGFEQNGGVSSRAQMIAEGKVDPATARTMLRQNPGLLDQVRRADPNFDEANIAQRYGTLKEFTSTSNSKAGGQVMALNTLIHHADLYLEVAKALKNGSFRPGNELYNRVASAFGAPPPTNAALIGRFFAGETGKVATGGVPAEGEINGILKNLSTANSPAQIEGAARTLLQIAGGRMVPLAERAKQAKIDNIVPVLGPDAKAILQRNGFDPETMKPAAAANPFAANPYRK